MNKLKYYRMKYNFNQEKLAEVLNIGQQQYSKLENGVSVLNVNQLLQLCELYEVTPNDLLGFKKEA